MNDEQCITMRRADLYNLLACAAAELQCNVPGYYIRIIFGRSAPRDRLGKDRSRSFDDPELMRTIVHIDSVNTVYLVQFERCKDEFEQYVPASFGVDSASTGSVKWPVLLQFLRGGTPHVRSLKIVIADGAASQDHRFRSKSGDNITVVTNDKNEILSLQIDAETDVEDAGTNVMKLS